MRQTGAFQTRVSRQPGAIFFFTTMRGDTRHAGGYPPDQSHSLPPARVSPLVTRHDSCAAVKLRRWALQDIDLSESISN